MCVSVCVCMFVAYLVGEFMTLQKQAQVTKAKQEILHNALSLLGTLAIMFIFILVLYYNYLMIRPYISPLYLENSIAHSEFFQDISVTGCSSLGNGKRSPGSAVQYH